MSLDATLQEWSELRPHTTKIDSCHRYKYFSFPHHNQMFQNENFKQGRVRDLISPETQLPSDHPSCALQSTLICSLWHLALPLFAYPYCCHLLTF